MNLWTSESVTEGHPDKLCDQISDAVLDACLAQDPDSHVACETSAISSSIHVFGEISTRAEIDIDAIARQVLRDVGYHFPFGLDAAKWDVRVDINQQSSRKSRSPSIMRTTKMRIRWTSRAPATRA